MWVLVVLMFNGLGDFRVMTSETIYFNEKACRQHKVAQDEALSNTKPNPEAHFRTACFKFPELQTARETLL